MTLIRPLDAPAYGIYLVRGPAGASLAQYLSEVSADPDVASVEPNADVVVPESPTGLQLNQSTASILDALVTPTVISFFGTPVLSSYVNQPAAALIRVANTQRFFATGAGIVAVIDTGVDPNQPVLKASLVPGFDFTRNLPGIPSEFTDLSQSTASILDQSTASILDQNTIVVLNQSTASVFNQPTASILDTTQVPQAFGHGTMVAGIIHLVAPTAQIMPLKAFKADGTSNLFDILRAIYFAVDHGAKVINMSFSMVNSSPELVRAINYANGHGLICVSSAGNTGKETLVFPAGYRNVMGVASTSNLDVRSTFSNFGHSLTFMTAPWRRDNYHVSGQALRRCLGHVLQYALRIRDGSASSADPAHHNARPGFRGARPREASLQRSGMGTAGCLPRTLGGGKPASCWGTRALRSARRVCQLRGSGVPNASPHCPQPSCPFYGKSTDVEEGATAEWRPADKVIPVLGSTGGGVTAATVNSKRISCSTLANSAGRNAGAPKHSVPCVTAGNHQ